MGSIEITVQKAVAIVKKMTRFENSDKDPIAKALYKKFWESFEYGGEILLHTGAKLIRTNMGFDDKRTLYFISGYAQDNSDIKEWRIK